MHLSVESAAYMPPPSPLEVHVRALIRRTSPCLQQLCLRTNRLSAGTITHNARGSAVVQPPCDCSWHESFLIFLNLYSLHRPRRLLAVTSQIRTENERSSKRATSRKKSSCKNTKPFARSRHTNRCVSEEDKDAPPPRAGTLLSSRENVSLAQMLGFHAFSLLVHSLISCGTLKNDSHTAERRRRVWVCARLAGVTNISYWPCRGYSNM